MITNVAAEENPDMDKYIKIRTWEERVRSNVGAWGAADVREHGTPHGSEIMSAAEAKAVWLDRELAALHQLLHDQRPAQGLSGRYWSTPSGRWEDDELHRGRAGGDRAEHLGRAGGDRAEQLGRAGGDRAEQLGRAGGDRTEQFGRVSSDRGYQQHGRDQAGGVQGRLKM